MPRPRTIPERPLTTKERTRASRAGARASGWRRVELSLPENIINRLDSLADGVGLSRADLVAQLIARAAGHHEP